MTFYLLPMHPPLHVLVPLTINKSHSRRVELLIVVLRALPAQCETKAIGTGESRGYPQLGNPEKSVIKLEML